MERGRKRDRQIFVDNISWVWIHYMMLDFSHAHAPHPIIRNIFCLHNMTDQPMRHCDYYLWVIRDKSEFTEHALRAVRAVCAVRQQILMPSPTSYQIWPFAEPREFTLVCLGFSTAVLLTQMTSDLHAPITSVYCVSCLYVWLAVM